jgi:hypothetical protein
MTTTIREDGTELVCRIVLDSLEAKAVGHEPTVCVCVCVRARTCVRACVRACLCGVYFKMVRASRMYADTF